MPVIYEPEKPKKPRAWSTSHVCQVPRWTTPPIGMLWRCDQCNQLWEYKQFKAWAIDVWPTDWVMASWRTRWRHRKEGRT